MNVILCPRHGVSMGFATGVGQAKSTALRFLCLSLAKLRVAALSISDFFFLGHILTYPRIYIIYVLCSNFHLYLSNLLVSIRRRNMFLDLLFLGYIFINHP